LTPNVVRCSFRAGGFRNSRACIESRWSAQRHIEVRTVKVGLRVNDMGVIEEGLAAGERVVAEGVQAIRDGTVVRATAMSDQPVANRGTQPPSERK